VLLLGARSGSPRTTILGTILAERLLDVMALLAMLLVLVLVIANGVGSASELSLAAAAVLALLALALLIGWRLSRTGRLRGLSEHVASLTLASRNLLGVQGLSLVALTAVVWVGEGCVYWLVGRALSLHIDLPQGCFLVVLSSLAAIIPAAPGYAGTYDTAVQLGLRALHVRGGPAVAFGLLVRLVIFVPITAVGLVLMFARYGGLTSLARLRRTGSTAGAETSAAPAAEVPGSLAAEAPDAFAAGRPAALMRVLD
jgi:glycosyltransferase 2 family protein